MNTTSSQFSDIKYRIINTGSFEKDTSGLIAYNYLTTYIANITVFGVSELSSPVKCAALGGNVMKQQRSRWCNQWNSTFFVK
jgi:hypothetical protein